MSGGAAGASPSSSSSISVPQPRQAEEECIDMTCQGGITHSDPHTVENRRILGDALSDRLVDGDADAPDWEISAMMEAPSDASMSAVASSAEVSEATNYIRTHYIEVHIWQVRHLAQLIHFSSLPCTTIHQSKALGLSITTVYGTSSGELIQCQFASSLFTVN